ncbi:MAG: YraN family protein, partial [Candidatus Obscuribacterales bacterium]|nr:YraN family protein [Candidatus Obscuribacterales bacterium]
MKSIGSKCIFGFQATASSWRLAVGRLGEEAAAQYLADRHYMIVERNWREGRSCELDIIALSESGALIFVEVKTRLVREDRHVTVESAIQSVNEGKQRKIRRAAWSYLTSDMRQHSGGFCRFDLVIVSIGAYKQERSNSKTILTVDDEMIDI